MFSIESNHQSFLLLEKRKQNESQGHSVFFEQIFWNSSEGPEKCLTLFSTVRASDASTTSSHCFTLKRRLLFKIASCILSIHDSWIDNVSSWTTKKHYIQSTDLKTEISTPLSWKHNNRFPSLTTQIFPPVQRANMFL